MSSINHQLIGLVLAIPPMGRLIYRVAYGPIGRYLAYAWPIPGWLGRNEGLALAQLAPGGTLRFALCTLAEALELRVALKTRMATALRAISWEYGK